MPDNQTISTHDDRGGALIRRPDRPDHFMTLRAVEGEASAWVGSTRVARSRRALVVEESAKATLPPVVYFPPEDVRGELLVPADKTTSCPLKGLASYYDIDTEPPVALAAWRYQTTHTFDPRLARIECCVAFDTNLVAVEVQRT